MTIIRGSSTLWVHVAPVLPSYSLNIFSTTTCYSRTETTASHGTIQVYFIHLSSSCLGTPATTASARIVTTTYDIIMLIDILCNILIILLFYYFVCNGYVSPIQFIIKPTASARGLSLSKFGLSSLSLTMMIPPPDPTVTVINFTKKK